MTHETSNVHTHVQNSRTVEVGFLENQPKSSLYNKLSTDNSSETLGFTGPPQISDYR